MVCVLGRDLHGLSKRHLSKKCRSQWNALCRKEIVALSETQYWNILGLSKMFS